MASHGERRTTGPLKAAVRLSVRDVPEVLAEMRHEMANLLREFSKDERHLHTRAVLTEAAAMFEAGQVRRS